MVKKGQPDSDVISNQLESESPLPPSSDLEPDTSLEVCIHTYMHRVTCTHVVYTYVYIDVHAHENINEPQLPRLRTAFKA